MLPLFGPHLSRHRKTADNGCTCQYGGCLPLVFSQKSMRETKGDPRTCFFLLFRGRFVRWGQSMLPTIVPKTHKQRILWESEKSTAASAETFINLTLAMYIELNNILLRICISDAQYLGVVYVFTPHCSNGTCYRGIL